jgi:hypothetical protein
MTMFMRSSLRSLAALLVAGLLTVSLSACDSSGSNDESVDNRFPLDITATGGNSAAKATTETVEGFSFFVEGQDPQTSQQVFGLYFADDQNFSQEGAQNGLFGFIARASGQPSTGSYSVNDDGDAIDAGGFYMVLYKDFGTATGTYYVANSGTVDFTTSNDDRIEATVTLDATEYTFSSNQLTTNSVEISGTITSKDTDTFLSFSGFTP